MRVKITYGADIESVPEITKELLLKCVNNLRNTTELINRCVKTLDMPEINSGHASMNIGVARENLSDVDMSLADIQSLLIGLQKYYNGGQNVSEGRPTMDTSGSYDAPTEDS